MPKAEQSLLRNMQITMARIEELTATHINNIELGTHGRYRTNVNVSRRLIISCRRSER